MRLTSKQIIFLKNNRIVILSTADKESRPRAIFVEINQAAPDKIIITDNEMKISRKNILANKSVFILAFKPDYSYGLKISAVADYDKGKYLGLVKCLPENRKFNPKGAVVAKIKKVEEF